MPNKNLGKIDFKEKPFGKDTLTDADDVVPNEEGREGRREWKIQD